MHVKFIKKGNDNRYFTGKFANPFLVSDNVKVDDYTSNVSDLKKR